MDFAWNVCGFCVGFARNLILFFLFEREREGYKRFVACTVHEHIAYIASVSVILSFYSLWQGRILYLSWSETQRRIFCLQGYFYHAFCFTLRERLRTHKDLTKDQCFCLNYRKFSIKIICFGCVLESPR